MEKNPNENDTLGSSCIARISELEQQFLILECENVRSRINFRHAWKV